jgi:23S rRNA (adenine2503-C2)-methyltransferase
MRSAEDSRPDIAEIDRTALEQAFREAGIPSFHARQLYRWVYRKGVTDLSAMSDLGRGLRERLAASFRLSTLVPTGDDVSADGTRKLLFTLQDGRRIEAVYSPDTPKHTFCISSQVGCAMDCDFCLTGKMGFARNLTAGEIAGQVRALATVTGRLDRPFNIVLMGMGEPLHNYEAVIKALTLVADEHGLAVPARRITLSTVGIVPGMERLARERFMPNLAVSLHATTNALRDRLVPINRKYPIERLLEACRRFPAQRRQRITFEYVLLAGVNDSDADAERLADLLTDLRSKVNLLPLNPAPGIPFERPDDNRVDRFAARLARRGLTVSVRKSRGRDIRAACGQLIVEGPRRSPAQRFAAALDAG